LCFWAHLDSCSLLWTHFRGAALTPVGKQTHDLTVTASDSKTTQSGGDNRKKFPLGAALQVPKFFSVKFAYFGEHIKYHICSYIQITNLAYFLFITHTLASFCFQSHIHSIIVYLLHINS
jgi:hypothetical protein